MSVIWSFVWGIMTFVIMKITVKYYLPRLSERLQVSASEAPVAFKDTVGNNGILNNRVLTIIIIVACTCFAAWCGYTAAVHSVSAVSMLKMTVAMCVLCCIFITDLEFMIIPNFCSAVLLAGRLLTAVYEFIWMREEAIAWLLNSIIALAVCLLLLLMMSRVTRGGLGMGDVKLFSSLGFLCGVRAVCFTLVFAFLLCALVSTGLLITKKKSLKDSLPMGPFIWLGYGVTVLLSIR